MTQLERARVARQKIQALFPQIVEAKDELQRVIGEANTTSDGTIDEIRCKQLSGIVKNASGLLGSLLFWSDK